MNYYFRASHENAVYIRVSNLKQSAFTSQKLISTASIILLFT